MRMPKPNHPNPEQTCSKAIGNAMIAPPKHVVGICVTQRIGMIIPTTTPAYGDKMRPPNGSTNATSQSTTKSRNDIMMRARMVLPANNLADSTLQPGRNALCVSAQRSNSASTAISSAGSTSSPFSLPPYRPYLTNSPVSWPVRRQRLGRELGYRPNHEFIEQRNRKCHVSVRRAVNHSHQFKRRRAGARGIRVHDRIHV